MSRELFLGGTLVNDESDCYVIAEIGNNHQGDVEIAKQMVLEAKNCGASAVKFQKRDNKSFLTRQAFDAPYANENSYGATYGEHREFLELDTPELAEVQTYCNEIGITMFSTAFDLNSVDVLEELDIPFYKVASGDLRNTVLLEKIAKTGKPVLVSTGGGTMADVSRAYETIAAHHDQIALLQCTAAYPVLNYSEMNLAVITTYREHFPNTVIGLSDHENGTAMCLAAYMLGARIVEKHFTLNRAWKGTDHSFSLTPRGLAQVVKYLHRIKLALGDGVKIPTRSEESPIYKMSKSIVAARDLAAGEALTQADIAFKCPGNGLPPYEAAGLIGKILTADLAEDQLISREVLKSPEETE
ncbi:N-acetylneuraminate synthase [Pseudodesulfovibrio sp. F-1]|uniref:N-acetylneuraminate synthase n=1 Tax=Pseudodesulfovibrio alkaliphilus TaxID=2661613 RepID=A0A7K1KPK3_9BACT|nr:N-acetylneuraminate synthase family protein [Pseudodesulfovibrio alkaliphilus]MUM77811.1 N-acetylneuraminate synthase [Pseudodesulfovibrio alkaliphilus]